MLFCIRTSVLISTFSHAMCSFQAHAASAILNFSENCTAAILMPYLDGIVSKLLVLLQVDQENK